MRILWIPIFVALQFPIAAMCCKTASAADHQPLAFVGVDVISMSRAGVLRDQTVVVEDGRIARVGPRESVELPEGVLSIQGAGYYLLPGLADMHAHVSTTGDEVVNADLLLYLASGVTTLRNMVGSPAHLRLKERLAAGELTGTRFTTVSPLLEGEDAVWAFATQVVDPADAAATVAEFARAGYDEIKVYHTLSPQVYGAIMAEANRRALPVVGHVPFGIGIEQVLNAGQRSVEHLRGYDIDGVTAEVLALDGGRSPERFASWLHMSDARMDELVRATLEAGAWNCPTIIVNDLLANLDRLDAMRDHPLVRYLPPSVRERLSASPLEPLFSPEARAMLARAKPRQLEFIRKLHEGGAHLMIGTDSMVHSLIPGFTVVDEIANFVQAGLSPHAALAAATVYPARYLGTLHSSGTIEEGKLADLLLVEANPLDDVYNLRKVSGVIVGGRWWSKQDLQRELDGLAASWQARAAPAASEARATVGWSED